jgi:hypothetical protein
MLLLRLCQLLIAVLFIIGALNNPAPAYLLSGGSDAFPAGAITPPKSGI